MVKKIICAALSVLLCVGLFAGCTFNKTKLTTETPDGKAQFNLSAEEFKTEFNKKVSDQKNRQIGNYEIGTHDGQLTSMFYYADGVSVLFTSDTVTNNISGLIWDLDSTVATPNSDLWGRNVSTTILLLDPTLSSEEGKRILEELHLTDIDSWKIGSVYQTSKNGIKYFASIQGESSINVTIIPV